MVYIYMMYGYYQCMRGFLALVLYLGTRRNVESSWKSAEISIRANGNREKPV